MQSASKKGYGKRNSRFAVDVGPLLRRLLPSSNSKTLDRIGLTTGAVCTVSRRFMFRVWKWIPRHEKVVYVSSRREKENHFGCSDDLMLCVYGNGPYPLTTPIPHYLKHTIQYTIWKQVEELNLLCEELEKRVASLQCGEEVKGFRRQVTEAFGLAERQDQLLGDTSAKLLQLKDDSRFVRKIWAQQLWIHFG